MLKRLLCYSWAAPTSLLGLLLASLLLASGARARRVDGVLEVSGGWLANALTQLSGFAALTLGHVVLGHSADCLHRLRSHEHVHVRQAERWGIFFAPAYLLAGLWQWLRGRHAYYDNPFELEAFAVESGDCDHAFTLNG
ncbi:hypothetical protein [Methylophilus sp. 5]|uniref:hypothetical protein n=1 Tax=Methylophilus sp. 5 TaxID=1112274 RepID=UPI0004AF57E7|nr:hypothetical protein [Methylophilus sp. 5]